MIARIALVLSLIGTVHAQTSERPNVLLVCIDDLRPDLRCYGVPHAHTPQLDRFAATARPFRRHYVQVPTCGASRRALLTGRRPSQLAHLGNGACHHLPSEPESLPHAFRSQGYETVCIGKISHSPNLSTTIGPEKSRAKGPELPESWDLVLGPKAPWLGEYAGFFGYADGSSRTPGKSPTTERGPRSVRYPDRDLADHACEQLQRLCDLEGPWFLAVGFYKPHLPFNAPEEHWARFDQQFPPGPEQTEAPEGCPDTALHTSSELLKNYGSHPEGNAEQVGSEYARTLRQGYAAAVSYVDEQLGRLWDQVEQLELEDSTVVVLWSDHGWHLGDQGLWGKHSLFERSLSSPLMIRIPGLERPGQACWTLAETVDVYPTLIEVCGLEAPRGLTGQSLTAMLADPEWAPEEQTAVSFWRKGLTIGRSLRTPRYRYTRWTRRGRFVAEELYDYGPELEPQLEACNVADQFPELRGEFLELLVRLAPAQDFQK